MRAVLVAVIPLMFFSGCIGATDFYGKKLHPSPIVEFELYDEHGEQFNLSMIDSDVIMVGFIHTSCGEECDNLTSSMHQAYNLLSTRDQERVTLLSITTDPWHDNSNRLFHYKINNSVDWTHLTVRDINTDLAMIESTWASFGTSIAIVENQTESLARCSIHLMNYTVDHTVHAILIDHERNTRVQWEYSKWVSEDVAADIRRLASE